MLTGSKNTRKIGPGGITWEWILSDQKQGKRNNEKEQRRSSNNLILGRIELVNILNPGISLLCCLC